MKTLFQKWAEDNNKHVPDVSATQENPYLQALKLAEVRESTYRQRQERQARSWYEHHPKCKQVLLPIDWRDEQLRGEETIDINSRFGMGWFNLVAATHVQVGDKLVAFVEEERPEHRQKEAENIDDLLAMAAAMNTSAFKAEVETFSKQRRRSKKVSDKQMELVLN